jgi:autotransporter-associated beta strand protein
MKRRSSSALLRLGLALFGCALTTALHAATYTWDGSVNAWNSPHWLPGPVAWPGDGQDMVINGGTVLLAEAGNYRPQTITIHGGRLRIVGAGRLFPFTDATSRVITVHTNGTLELDTWFKADSQSLGRLAPDAGRLVLNGGTLRVNGVTGYGRGATVNSGGATLETGSDADWLLNQLTDDNAWVYNGNPTLIFTGSGIGRFEKAINSGTGGVIKRGVGKWTLTRTSSYSGDTVVEQGILVLRRGSLNDTSTVSIATGAVLSLRHYDGDVIGRLILGGVTMPAGTYSRATHPQFISGSGSLVIGSTNTTSTPSLTWYYGSGGDATIRAQLTNSMNYCVDTYNNYAYIHGSIRADYSSGVPTAQASFGGPITFGGSRSGRVAMHEMGHVFGVGTHGNWGANLSGGVWRGAKGARLIQQIDGPGAVIGSDGTHFWPYGLNYDNEGGARNEICHVRMMEAFMQDMGIYQGISTISSVGDRNIPTNSSTGPISVTIGDPGVSAGSLVLHASSSNPAFVPASGIVLGGSGANRTVNVTPVPHLTGSAIIALTVSGGRDAAIETFAITVGSFSWNGGDGDWDLTSSNWNNSTTVWPSIGGNNDAFFGGAPGVVTVRETIRADDLTFDPSGYVLTNGTLRFDVSPAITVSNGVATIASALEGTPDLTKEGAGTLVLTGNHPYTGRIVVNGGALFIHGTATEAATVEARNGTLLGGSGSLAPVTVRAGAELSPGPQPDATLTTEGLTLDGGSTLTLDLDVIGDRVLVNGNVALNGMLNIRASGSVANGDYVIIRYTGARSGIGLTLANVPAGYSMALDYGTPGEVRLLVTGGLDRLPIVAAGSVWKFNAAGADLGTAWRSHSYNDAGWSNGPTQIGYGDGDEATPINVGAGRPQIVYFRHAFTLTAEEIGALSNSVLSLLRDDGAVVYLNGTEVRRDNMPAAPATIAYNTPALIGVGNADENTFFPSPLHPGLFVPGTNLLAVEVHQNDPASSDISFDLKLEGLVPGVSAPAVFVPVSLIATGATWKYFDGTNDLGTAWRDNAFDDATWNSGSSMLGYGDANGLLPSTLVASNGQITTYFRRAVVVPNPAQVRTLTARVLRDDAAVVHLNGAEIWRDENLPSTGAINYDTRAQTSLSNADESAWLSFALSPAALLPGTNIIAIEVHQSAANSSDLAMNFELNATLLLPASVRLALTGDTLSWPADAGWFSLESATNLTPPVAWTPFTNAPVLMGDHWLLTLPDTTNGQRFFRLQTP